MSIAELRKTRMAQGLSLTEISRRTRIGVSHLRHIEEGDFKSLPPGFYARAFVRAYVDAIGVDADIVLGELADQLPASQAASAPHPGPTNPQPALPWTDASHLIPDARMQVLKQLLRRHNEHVSTPATPVTPAAAADKSATGMPRGARRFLAASVDGLLLASIYLCVIGVTALLCGVAVTDLMRMAGVEVLTVLALITLLYVLLMGGIAGRTIGAMLLDVPLIERAGHPMDLGTIARRSVHCVRADVAAAADVGSLIEALLGRSHRAA